MSPRFDVPVRSAQLTPDGRTLVLATDSVSRGVHYALTLPGDGNTTSDEPGALPQHAAIDLDFDLTGCEATWQPNGWCRLGLAGCRMLDLEVSHEFTKGSAPHEALWKSLEGPGELTCAASSI